MFMLPDTIKGRTAAKLTGQININIKKPLARFSGNLKKIRFELRKIGSDILRPASGIPVKGNIGPSLPFE